MLPEVTLRDISREDRHGSAPVVTITGLPGSGSEVVGMEIARTTGGRLVDDEEITRRMCQRLGRTVGELKAFEASCRSVWSRMLRALLAPWERYGVYDGATTGWERGLASGCFSRTSISPSKSTYKDSRVSLVSWPLSGT